MVRARDGVRDALSGPGRAPHGERVARGRAASRRCRTKPRCGDALRSVSGRTHGFGTSRNRHCVQYLPPNSIFWFTV